jgi:hypothetical protein
MGKQNGYGCKTTTYGEKYTGNFLDNHYNGKGVLTTSDGDRKEGEFEND